MTRDRIVAVVLLVLLVAAAAFGSRSPRDESRTRSTYRDNPGGAGAWYELAQREHLPVNRFALPHTELDAARAGTLVQTLPGSGAPLTWATGDNQRVHDWIAAGGHLVVVGPFTPDADDKSEFDLASHHVDGKDGALRGPWAKQIRTLPLRGERRLDATQHARVLLSDALGVLVARVTTGKGWVTESIAVAPIENANLGSDDNAILAYLLLDPQHVRGPIAFDEGLHGFTGVVRTWYEALTAGELLALGIALFALLLWLLAGAFRSDRRSASSRRASRRRQNSSTPSLRCTRVHVRVCVPRRCSFATRAVRFERGAALARNARTRRADRRGRRCSAQRRRARDCARSSRPYCPEGHTRS